MKAYSYSISLTFFLVLLIACNSNTSNKANIIKLLPAVELKSTPIKIETDILIPSKMFLYNNMLITYENIPSGKFKVFSIPTLKFLYSFGITGNGPSDFENIDKESVNVSEFVEIQDNKKIKFLSFSNLNGKIIKEKKIETNHVIINKLRKINDSIYFCENLYSKKQPDEYRKLNINSGKYTTFGSLPIKPDEKISIKDLTQIGFRFMKSNCYNNYYNKFFSFYYYLPTFKIYSGEGDLVQNSTINVNESRFSDEKQKNIYFTEPYATDEFVYVMWIGKSKKDVSTNFDSFKPNLLVFSLNGKLMANYQLDQPIITYSVSSDNKQLYACSFKDPNIIYKYDLPEIKMDSLLLNNLSNNWFSTKILDGYSFSSINNGVNINNTFKQVNYTVNSNFLIQRKQKRKFKDLESIKLSYYIPKEGTIVSEKDMKSVLNLNGGQSIRSNIVKFGNMKVLYSTYIFKATDPKGKVTQLYFYNYIFVKNNRIIQFEVASVNSDFEKYKESFTKIITTFNCKL